MLITQKCQYAIRAVFELAKRHGEGPTKIADIACNQAIPVRFLEVILGQLKLAGFVASHRGAGGGYALRRESSNLSVGEVMRFGQGSITPVECKPGKGRPSCPLDGDCVFKPMWQEAEKAMSQVYDSTSFQDLVERDKQKDGRAVSYSI